MSKKTDTKPILFNDFSENPVHENSERVKENRLESNIIKAITAKKLALEKEKKESCTIL
jgi:hypothetical protein